MRIEKNYYTEEAELWQRAGQKEEEDVVNQTYSQEKEDEQSSSFKAQETMDKALIDRKKHFQVLRRDRFDYFEKLSRSAVELAEAAPLDVIIESEQSFGRISFRADRLMFLPSTSVELKESFAGLIREAESIDFAVGENGLLQLSFVFSFASKIPHANPS